jgi:hypothetical protein
MNIIKVNENCDGGCPCHHTCDVKIKDEITSIVLDSWIIGKNVSLKRLNDSMLKHFEPYQPECHDVIKSRVKAVSVSRVYNEYNKLYTSSCHQIDAIYRQIMLTIKHAHIKHRLQACMRNGYTGFAIYQLNGIFAVMTDTQRKHMIELLKKRIHRKGLDDVVVGVITDDMVYVCFNAGLYGETDGRGQRILVK